MIEATYTMHIPEYGEYHQSIMEKAMPYLKKYCDAQLNLHALDQNRPHPRDYQIRKALYFVQMIAAQNKMMEIINPET